MLKFSLFCFTIVLNILFYFILLFPTNIMLHHFLDKEISLLGFYAFGTIISLLSPPVYPNSKETNATDYFTTTISVLFVKIILALIFWLLVYLSY